MDRFRTPHIVLPLILLVAAFLASPVSAQDEDIAVEEGGIDVPGWRGMLDGNAEGIGEALLTMEGSALHVRTGPNVTYWNPENTASGDYTVSATFTEPEYMNLNNHPHPYGLFIGGSDLGTENARFLYCAAYGNGSFIVRGFGPEPFQMNGPRAEAHDAVNAADGQGEPVTQQIALSVDGDQVSCSINGTTVGSYATSEVVGEERIASTDGVYGIRFGHNTEGLVSNLTLMAD